MMRYVGGILDTGALREIGGENKGNRKETGGNRWESIRKCAESIAMMIYYCQGTGSSLSSQYSLQESTLK